MFNLFKPKLNKPTRIEHLKILLENVEADFLKENNWDTTLEVNIILLNQLLPTDLIGTIGVCNNIMIHSGFKNVVHFFDWTTAVVNHINDRRTLDESLSLIPYHRKTKSLDKFLLTQSNTRYPIDEFYINMRNELVKIKHLLDDIADPRYKDHVKARTKATWADVFAITESLCILGVSHE